MERLDAATGIIGGGLISGGSQPQDWERRIGERSEQLYRARLIQRLFLVWAYPGNLVLVGLAVAAMVLFGPSISLVAVLAVVSIGSMAVSARFVYQQHFRVRSVETELRELERAHREYLLEELSTGDLLGTHKRYRAQLPEVVDVYRAEARQYRWKDNLLQSVVIAGSIMTASVTAISVSVVDFRWGSAAASLVVAISAAYAGYAKYRERSAGLQQTADALEREYQSVELRAGRYRRFGDERAAYAEFADTVEAVRAEQAKRQQQLGQAGGPPSMRAFGQ
ncbi:DUF4231 domain-containing protein [Parasphingorhabdus pacifica]